MRTEIVLFFNGSEPGTTASHQYFAASGQQASRRAGIPVVVLINGGYSPRSSERFVDAALGQDFRVRALS